MTAKKFDQQKIDLSLLPLPFLEQTAQALMYGEKKYGRYNYTSGFDSHRIVAAFLRHALAYQNGEDLDPESGLPHLGHAGACLAMLAHTQALGTNKDTRLGKQATFAEAQDAAVKLNAAIYSNRPQSQISKDYDKAMGQAMEVDEKFGVYPAKGSGK